MSCGCKSGSVSVSTGTCSSSCNSCGCSTGTCGCVRPQTAVPMPFYEQACEVQETHVEQIIYESYATTVKTSSTFNMPACDATATLTVPGLKNIQIGSYLWNATYGYLKVESFDYLAAQVVVRNECQTGNAAAGTSIPACTLFTVTDPPHDAGSGQLGVFVAVDFVAPANGNCIDIAVTSVAGLVVGSNVQISSGIYRVSGIVDNTTITICNDGSGVTPATIVYAKDGSGLYITPVTPLSSNACENTPNTTGAILSCHNNVQAPLSGTAVGQIPVLINAITGEAQYQSLDMPVSICTTMESCLNLIAGTTVYIIVVTDSSIFVLGDIIIIHDPVTEAMRWEVTGIPDASHVQITSLDPVVVSAEAGCNNAPVCLAPCCEQLAAGTQICSYDWSAAFKADTQHEDGANETGIILDVDLPQTDAGAVRSVVVSNTTCNDMEVLVHFDYIFTGYFGNDTDGVYESDSAKWAFKPYNGADTVAIADPFPVPGLSLISNQIENVVFGPTPTAEGEVGDPYPSYVCKNFHFCEKYTLAAGTKLNAYGRLDIEYISYQDANNSACVCVADPVTRTPPLNIQSQITRVHAMGVAVQAAP